MLVLAGILLSLAAASFILAPLVRHVAAPLTDGTDVLAQLRELDALKNVTYETLQDIEFDYHAGKISERDYRDMTDRFTSEAVRLVQRIEEIEARVPRPRGRRPGGA
jgi:hypothetical protein